MSRIEAAMKSKKAMQTIIEGGCPGDYGVGPTMEFETAKYDPDRKAKFIGCRGINCHECWKKREGGEDK